MTLSTEIDAPPTERERVVAEPATVEVVEAPITDEKTTEVPARDPDYEVNTMSYQGEDRRDVVIRREPLSFFSLRQISSHKERRTPGRRADDWEQPYVDWYEPRLMWAVVAVMLLAAAHTFLTLELYHLGEMNLNPLMADLLENSTSRYIVLQLTLTALALTLMTIYKNFPLYRLFRVGQVIYLTLAVYLALVISSIYVWLTL